jgi:cytochrome c-type biogenesis protein CcmH
MVFWFLCALLTTATIVVLLMPLVRNGGGGTDLGQADARVYKDQLAEIDRELERGLIQSADAEAARTEIARRLLGAADKPATPTDTADPAGPSSLWVYGSAVFVLAFSLVAYLGFGRPGQPGTNHAERARQDPRTLRVSEQIARVEARLRERPDDAAGWDVIAPVYLRLGRYSDAADAFRRAMSLRGESPERLVGFAQAQLGMTNGIVTSDAKEALEKLLKQRPKSVAARFWLALAKEQAGDKVAAAAAYNELLVDPSVAPKLRDMLTQRLAAIGAKSAAPPKAPDGPSPPGGAAGAAIAALPPAERLKAIKTMVASLAARLEQDGNDQAGWQRLVRAYMVLGERDKAQKALEAAKKALAGNGQALADLERTAARFGLKH